MSSSSGNTLAPGVSIQRAGPVTVVVLNRPEVRNAVDDATAQALFDAFVAFEDDPDARVAVFHGAHGHFCAGWDLQYGARLAARGCCEDGRRCPEPADYVDKGQRWPVSLISSLHVACQVFFSPSEALF